MECPLVLRGLLKHHVNSQNVFGRRWLSNISISILNAARRFATVTTPTSKFIGIDLGTTNSCVAFLEGGRPVVASNPDDGSRTTPSVVAFTSEGSVLVGSPAKRQAVSNPHNTVFAVKRLVGRRFDDPQIQHCVANFPFAVVQSSSGAACVSLHGRTYTASEISAHIVSEMKRIAENQLGCAVKHAVITVPAYFDDAQRQATKEAGELAGLTVDRVVNEPTAAALAYGIDKTEDKLIAVYDLGGGTFDISILEIQKGVFEVRSTNGDTMLGGEDFDNLLADQIVGKILSQFGKDVRQHPPALQRVKEAAEQAKIALSTSQSTTISLPFIITDDSGSTHFEMELTRLEFESMVDDLVKRTILPCEQAVLDAGIRKKEINELILVGGMTRMPKVRETVQRLFNIEPAKGVNPDEAVAVGAAIQAGVLSGEVEDVLLLDVTPLSLGIETLGGAMARLITRNTTLPTKVTEVFSTAVDGQTQVEINIYQGEREMAKDNKLLGSFTLMDIPPLPRGVPRIEVSFDIDANGILNVSARDQKTGQAQRLLVTNAITNLPQRDVEAMLRSASEAADTDRRRRLLADAKLAVKILSGDVLSKLATFGSQLPTEESQALRQFCQTALQRAEEATETDLEAVRSLNQEIQEKALAVFQMATRKTSGGPEKSH